MIHYIVYSVSVYCNLVNHSCEIVVYDCCPVRNNFNGLIFALISVFAFVMYVLIYSVSETKWTN
jgi:hypothetical protein